MKIAVMGSGGVGGYFGARLSQAGIDVTFLARGDHLKAIRASGLEVRTALGDFVLKPTKATSKPGEIGVVDVVLLAVKCWDTEQAAYSIRPIVGPRTAVISLQNGVENDGIIRSALPEGIVLGGVCYIASRIRQPGVIEHTGAMQKLIFGDNHGQSADLAGEFLKACRGSGIDAEIRSDIERAIWEKFVFLVGLSGTTTAIRAPIGVVRSHPQTRLLLLEAMQEVVEVGRAKGVAIEADFAQNRLEFCDSLPAEMTSSMHGDLQRGGRLEVEWLSGSVARFGESLGVPTPVNRLISAILAPVASGAVVELERTQA